MGQKTLPIASTNIKKLNWLEGTWERTNVKPGTYAHERWEKTSTSSWEGLGVAMQGNDTTFIEKLRIIKKDSSIYYEADVPENTRQVLFQFTKLDKGGFTCENPEHDFPKKIRYLREKDKLIVQISGDGKSIDFLFIRK